MISIIAAIGKNRELGKDNKLLWHIPEDLKRFKELTLGHPIIMGRKTFESIGRVLPGRTNIIISRNLKRSHLPRLGAIIVDSLEEAISYARHVILSEAKNPKERSFGLRPQDDNTTEIFIIGGGEIFKQAIPLADKLYLTIVDKEFDADTFFPDYSEFKKVIFKKEGKTGEYKYKFIELER